MSQQQYAEFVVKGKTVKAGPFGTTAEMASFIASVLNEVEDSGPSQPSKKAEMPSQSEIDKAANKVLSNEVEAASKVVPEGYKFIGLSNAELVRHGRTYPKGSPMFVKKSRHMVANPEGASYVAKSLLNPARTLPSKKARTPSKKATKAKGRKPKRVAGLTIFDGDLIIAGFVLKARVVHGRFKSGSDATIIHFVDNIKEDFIEADSEAIRAAMQKIGGRFSKPMTLETTDSGSTWTFVSHLDIETLTEQLA